MRSRLLAVPVAIALAVMLSGCGTSSPQAAAPSTTTPAAPRLALAADAATATNAGGGQTEPAIYPKLAAPTYSLYGTLADLGPAAPVRKLLAHDVTSADLTRIADALGMKGTPVATALGYELRSADATLTVDTTSNVTVVDYSNVAGGASVGSSPPSAGAPSDLPVPVHDAKPEPLPQPPMPETPMPETPMPETPMPTTPPPVDVPSADGAVTIAQTLLDKFGVLTGQQWSHEVEDPNTAVSDCPPDADCAAPTPSPVSARTVTFQLLLDGVPVPGVSWSVTIGEHGHVDYLSGSWARPGDAHDYALRSTTKVFDDLKNGTAQYVIGSPGGEVRVTGVVLGVARWDGTENGKTVAYLVPTYRFHIAGVDGASRYAEVLALDPAGFNIAPTTDAPVPEPAGQELIAP